MSKSKHGKVCARCLVAGGKRACGFSACSAAKDGLQAYCRVCKAEWGRDRRPSMVVSPGGEYRLASRDGSTDRPLKIVTWDLECTNLNADFGYLLCMGWKVLGEKEAHVVGIDDLCKEKRYLPDDRKLVEQVHAILSDADMWVTWYGVRFDLRFFRARLAYHRLPPLPNVPHADGWVTSRYEFKLHSNRLDAVAKFLELDHQKTPVLPPTWQRASAGFREDLGYIKQHCLRDVEVLEETYLRIRPFVRRHPPVSLLAGATDPRCPTCGSSELSQSGTHFGRTRSYLRYQCGSCGAWSNSTRSGPGKVSVAS